MYFCKQQCIYIHIYLLEKSIEKGGVGRDRAVSDDVRVMHQSIESPGGGGAGHAGILLRKKSLNSTHPHWQGPILWQYAPPLGHGQQEYTSS